MYVYMHIYLCVCIHKLILRGGRQRRLPPRASETNHPISCCMMLTSNLGHDSVQTFSHRTNQDVEVVNL